MSYLVVVSIAALLTIILFLFWASRNLKKTNEKFKKVNSLSKQLELEVAEKTNSLKEAKESAERAHKNAVMAKKIADEQREEAEKARKIAEEARIEAQKSEEKQRAAKQKIEEQAKVLKELDEQKTHFFQTISHELRTPLTLIMGPADQLHDSINFSRNVDLIQKNTRRLYRLVNQLLDFQKLSAGKKRFDLMQIDLKEFLGHCGDYFASSCEAKNISFSISIDENVDSALILAEADSLEKIIFNYLSNAFKYTPEHGSIVLGLRLNTDDAGVNRLRVSVKDTGPGIDKEAQSGLFEVFSQVEGASTKYQGTGLGLALVKELSSKMSAKFGVDSSPGEGSEFWIDFVRDESHKKTITDILVVDDDPDVLFSLELEMSTSDFGWKIMLADGPEKAREILADNKFKCVISDARMPGENGASLLNFVNEISPETKKILITGYTDREVLKNALNEAKTNYFLYKPWDREELFNKVGGLIKEFEAENQSYARLGEYEVGQWHIIEETEEAEDTVQVAFNEENSETGLILVVDDLKDMRNLISNFVKELGYTVLTAKNGKEGFEIASARRPDLILTDWMMPEMSGPEMIGRLKENPDLKSVPTVLLTAKSDEESKKIGTEIGADAYLGKPFDKRELGSTIGNLLRLKSRERLYQKELELASKLQNLLNRGLTLDLEGLKASAHFSSWSEVGGDFMLLEELDENNTFFMIGDVSGHGPQSALLSFYLRGLIDHLSDSLFTKTIDQAQFLETLIAKVMVQFSDKIQDNNFATYFMGVIDNDNRKLYFRNGGHPPAMLIRDGSDNILFEFTDGPFGIPEIGHRPDSISTFDLINGDRLLVINDSFTELPGEKFGRDLLGTKKVVTLSERFFSEDEEHSASNYADYMLRQSENQHLGYQDDCSVFLFSIGE